MIRLFVALDLPDAVREALAQIQNGLPGAKWVRPENLHLTLRFVGEVDGATFQDILSALDGVHAPGFELGFSELGLFGDRHRAKTLWAGVQSNPGLQHLQGRVEAACQRAGLAPERRKFMPHITLAKLGDVTPERLNAFIQTVGPLQIPSFTVTDFTLFSSFLAHTGAIYRPEEDYHLDPPRTIMELTARP